MSWQAVQYVGDRFNRGDLELPCLARQLAWAIAWRINPDTRLTYTGAWLAATCGCSERSLRKPLGQLVDAGLFVLEHRPGKASRVHLPADAVPLASDAVPSYPHPAPASAGSEVVDIHTPRSAARYPAPASAPPRAGERAVPEYIPETDTCGSATLPPDDMSDVVDVAVAAARLEREQAERDGVKIRNKAGYEDAVADRLVSDELHKIRHALNHPGTTHERAEYVIGRRRSIA